MIVSHDLTILAMIVNASIVVKTVMAVLVPRSSVDLHFAVFARRAKRQAETSSANSGAAPTRELPRAAGGRYVAGMERIFEAGFRSS
jgi:hypothetical protein